MSCYTAECKRARRNGRIAIAAVAIVGIMAFGMFILPALSPYITPSGPKGATGQAVYFKVSTQYYGGGQPTTGRIDFFDTEANNWGGNTFSTTSAGILACGPIKTGYTYQMYFNGTSTYLPNSWSVPVGAITDLAEPANYYLSVTMPDGRPFTIYKNATAYSDTLIDVTTGALSGAIRTQTGTGGAMANDTITHNVETTFQYTVTVSSTYTARLPQYSNPAYPNSGAVQGFVYIITNSTNVYAKSGATVITLASNSIIIVPISMVIAGATSASQTVMFTLVFPTATKLTVYGGTVWNTNMEQLQNAKSTTWASLSAPVGYTVCKMQLLGNSAGSYTYCLWTIS